MSTSPAPADNRLPIMKFLEAADHLVHVATTWEPEAMVEVVAVWARMSEVLSRVAEGYRILGDRAEHYYPVNPLVVELIRAVHGRLVHAATRADEVAPAIKTLHGDRLAALDDPKGAMWDHRVNNGAGR